MLRQKGEDILGNICALWCHSSAKGHCYSCTVK